MNPNKYSSFSLRNGSMFFNPFACVDERFNPRSHFIVFAVKRVPGILPREDGSFQVRHHGQMTTVGTADTGNGIIASVRIPGIFVIVVFGNDIVFVFAARQRETSFTVRNPKTKFVAAQGTEHHALVLRNRYTDKLAFEFLRFVVQHAGALFMFRIDEIELYHELATVTDT